MPVINADVVGGAANSVDLAVVAENLMDVRVAAGAFKIAGVDRDLLADQVHTCTADPNNITTVTGFLVKDTSTDTVELLVDETVLDGVDAGYSFKDGDYNMLHRLFDLRVPAAATDITSEDLRVVRIVPPPKE